MTRMTKNYRKNIAQKVEQKSIDKLEKAQKFVSEKSEYWQSKSQYIETVDLRGDWLIKANKLFLRIEEGCIVLYRAKYTQDFYMGRCNYSEREIWRKKI